MAAGEISAILAEFRDGDALGWEKLAPLVYDELRRLASRQLRREGGRSGSPDIGRPCIRYWNAWPS